MVTLTAHGYTVVGKGLAFFFLAWSSLHQFPQKHQHIHSRQLIWAMCNGVDSRCGYIRCPRSDWASRRGYSLM